MKIRFSRGMQRALEDIKEEVISVYEDKLDTKMIRIKPTKKKELKALLVKYETPCFTLFVNGDCYGTFFYRKGIWSEEK